MSFFSCRLLDFNMLRPILLLILAFFNCKLLDAHDLVDIQEFDPKIHINSVYASENNDFGKVLYPSSRIFVDRYVAIRLKRVETELAKEGIGLVIYQGYRPPSVQTLFSNSHGDCKYCQAWHAEDAPHYTKGLGVDVSLFYLSGQPLEMPCLYGEICTAASCNYIYSTAQAYHNRCLLEKYMMSCGFVPDQKKWWHFDLKNCDEAPNLNVEYHDLLKN